MRRERPDNFEQTENLQKLAKNGRNDLTKINLPINIKPSVLKVQILKMSSTNSANTQADN